MARRRSKKRSLVDFLRSWLANGPLPSRDIEQMARDEGINDRTIQRAKIEAGVESFMVWRAGKPVWYMRLHGDQTEIPSVDDGDEIGTGRHTLVRPADRGEVHPQAAGGNAEPSGTVDAGGSGRGTAGAQPGEPAKPDAKAIAAAFLSRTVGGAQ
jgi:hypothetical protein